MCHAMPCHATPSRKYICKRNKIERGVRVEKSKVPKSHPPARPSLQVAKRQFPPSLNVLRRLVAHVLPLCPHIAISACSFLSSSSSSSSSTRCGALPLTSDKGAWGSLPTLSPTGTFPVLSMSSSSFSCWSSASSSSSSSSSMPVGATPEVMASLISSPMACCSRRSSLW